MLLAHGDHDAAHQGLRYASMLFGCFVSGPRGFVWMTFNGIASMQIWRNNTGVVEKLLAAGASTEVADGESGW